MMLIGTITVSFLVGVTVGISIWTIIVARDPKVIRINEDEVIVKRPPESMVLVAVTPEIARRLVNTVAAPSSPERTEARSLYPERSRTGPIPNAKQ